MGVSIIDGEVEAAEVRRKNRKFHIYSTLRFRTADGSSQTIKNAAAANEVAERLVPGSQGRFYVVNSIDHRGVYAVRDASGTTVRKYPGENEKIGLLAIGLGIVAMVLYETFGEGTPILVLLALLLGALAYFFTRRSRIEAEKVFAADNTAAPATVA